MPISAVIVKNEFPSAESNFRSAAFRVCVKNAPEHFVLVVVLVLAVEFSGDFEDEDDDENEGDGPQPVFHTGSLCRFNAAVI